jgi:hypothetical protein
MPYLDLRKQKNAIVHRPSGRACPQTLAGGAILLQSVDADASAIHCAYREGPDLTSNPDAPVKYRLIFGKDPGTPAAAMKDLVASARQVLPIKADKAPPLATGRAPKPQAAQFWTMQDGGVQGIWLGKTGAWMTRLQVDYPDTPANEAQARAIAEAVFAR